MMYKVVILAAIAVTVIIGILVYHWIDEEDE